MQTLPPAQAGMTPVHLAARYGHAAVISEFVKQNISLRNLSRKLGMTALHIAAFYGEEDIVRELMRHVPPSVKSEVSEGSSRKSISVSL